MRAAPGVRGAQHVGDGGERVVVEFALAGEVFGEGAAAGDAGGDGFADMAQLAGRERRLHRGAEAGEGGVGADGRDLGQVGGREHVRLVARRLAQGGEAGMGDRAAEEGDLEGAGAGDVGDVAAAAAEEARVLLAAQGGADAGPGSDAEPCPGVVQAASASTGRGRMTASES